MRASILLAAALCGCAPSSAARDRELPANYSSAFGETPTDMLGEKPGPERPLAALSYALTRGHDGRKSGQRFRISALPITAAVLDALRREESARRGLDARSLEGGFSDLFVRDRTCFHVALFGSAADTDARTAEFSFRRRGSTFARAQAVESIWAGGRSAKLLDRLLFRAQAELVPWYADKSDKVKSFLVCGPATPLYDGFQLVVAPRGAADPHAVVLSWRVGLLAPRCDEAMRQAIECPALSRDERSAIVNALQALRVRSSHLSQSERQDACDDVRRRWERPLRRCAKPKPR